MVIDCRSKTRVRGSYAAQRYRCVSDKFNQATSSTTTNHYSTYSRLAIDKELLIFILGIHASTKSLLFPVKRRKQAVWLGFPMLSLTCGRAVSWTAIHSMPKVGSMDPGPLPTQNQIKTVLKKLQIDNSNSGTGIRSLSGLHV